MTLLTCAPATPNFRNRGSVLLATGGSRGSPRTLSYEKPVRPTPDALAAENSIAAPDFENRGSRLILVAGSREVSEPCIGTNHRGLILRWGSTLLIGLSVVTAFAGAARCGW